MLTIQELLVQTFKETIKFSLLSILIKFEVYLPLFPVLGIVKGLSEGGGELLGGGESVFFFLFRLFFSILSSMFHINDFLSTIKR